MEFRWTLDELDEMVTIRFSPDDDKSKNNFWEESLFSASRQAVSPLLLIKPESLLPSFTT